MRSALITSLSLLSLLFSSVAASVKPPSLDPWYSQPINISNYEAGTAIRSRSVNTKLEALLTLPMDVSVKCVVQYLFRTTDSLGKAAASVVTLIEPKNSNPTKLLGYQVYYDSANVDSSPSYLIQTRNETLDFYEPDFGMIGAALNKGWWVYTTDYEGLDAQYTAGLQSGHAVLDSTRAVLKEGQSKGLSANPRYALWGYSGGSLASAWAAELQYSYAPELNFSGVALGGTVPNITSVTQTINNGLSAGLAFSGTFGTAKAFPNMTGWLNQTLIPSKAAEFYSIANGSYYYANMAGANKDIFSFFKGGERAFLDAVPQTVFQLSGT
ncbi:hypothetical protein N7478_009781 [Penicillium angulare]|uniref:uncharacterized protein n=1 Tax=Penicillium angulare TaxID=116970 RepID=UPI00253F819D|nr:uncharacterized protein N7478_009781 [Penicillium angulare]KAJ5266973.1 hypothetical protein N7478_009781 [Penicillium angulare]